MAARSCPGGVSGWSNAAENIVAGAATNHSTQTVDIIGRCHTLSDPWEIITNHGQNGHDAVRLYNEDHRYLVRNHFYFNDGKATMIRIEATSHPHWHCTVTP